MEIGQDSRVKMHYTLKLSDGTVLESSFDGDPIEFEYGKGQIIPGLESALEGMSAGEEKHVEIGPDDAYGQRDPEAVASVPKDEFPAQGPIEAGMIFRLVREDGMVSHVRVAEVMDDEIKLDFNHPLAGETLHFDVKVEDVEAPEGRIIT